MSTPEEKSKPKEPEKKPEAEGRQAKRDTSVPQDSAPKADTSVPQDNT